MTQDNVIREMRLVMDHEEMIEVAARIAAAMNDTHFEDGYPIDKVLMSALFLLGARLKARGLILDAGSSLRAQLPPLLAGYDAVERDERFNQ